MRRMIRIMFVISLIAFCVAMISCNNEGGPAGTTSITELPITVDVYPLPPTDDSPIPIGTPEITTSPTLSGTPTPAPSPTPSIQLKNVYLTIEAIDENGFAGSARVFGGFDTTVTPDVRGVIYLKYSGASEKFGLDDDVFFSIDPSKLSQESGKCIDSVNGTEVEFDYVVSEVFYPDCEPAVIRPLIPAVKPIIYLYPQEETLCSVKINLDGEFSCTYPSYGDNGWRDFIAKPDGTLVFPNGREYYALYWEGKINTKSDFSKGFCVKGEDSAAFFEDVLGKIGLSEREANEFIVYWLPIFEQNEYNLVTFNTENYSAAAELEITPTPDSILRVYMQYKAVNEFVDIVPQEFESFERKGFTVVEWGGGYCG